MASGFFAGGLAEGISAGLQRQTERKKLRLAESQLKLEQDEFLLEKEKEESRLKAIADIAQQRQTVLYGKQSVASKEDYAKGLNTISGMRQLAAMPKSVRSGQVDAWAEGEKAKGNVISPAFISMLKQGSAEELLPYVNQLYKSFESNELSHADFKKAISDPNGFNQMMQGLQRDVTEPQNAFQRQMKKIDQQINDLSNLQFRAASSGNEKLATAIRNDIATLQTRKNNIIKLLPGRQSEGTQQVMGATGKSDVTQLDASDFAQARRQERVESISDAAAQAGATTTAKLSAQQRFEENQQAPALVTSILGIDPNVTQGQLKAAGIRAPRDEVQARELQSATKGFENVLATTNQIFNLIDQNPDVVGASGSIARITDTARTQAAQIARLAGIETKANLNPDNWKDEFKRIGVQNTQLQSAFIDLAYAAAVAQGQTGRAISDTDIERFLKSIGAGAGTKQGMQLAMMGYLERAGKDYNATIKLSLGENALSVIPKSPYTMSLEDIDKISAEQFQQLTPEDQRAIGMRIDFLDRMKQR